MFFTRTCLRDDGVATRCAISRYHVKLTKFGTNWGRGSAVTLLFNIFCIFFVDCDDVTGPSCESNNKFIFEQLQKLYSLTPSSLLLTKVVHM